MKPFALAPSDVTAEAVRGAVLCHDVIAVGETGRVRLRKGLILQSEHVAALKTFGSDIHLLALEPGDVHEDAAAIRLARAVAGPGVRLTDPVESQVHMRAEFRGLCEVDFSSLLPINCLPDISVFTVYDGQPVDEGKAVGACKVTPLAIPDEILRQAEQIAHDRAPIVTVRPFTGASVGVVVRERIAGTARQRFQEAITRKLRWFGSDVAGIAYLPDDVDDIAGAFTHFAGGGVGLILAAGVNSTDPLDLTLQALERVGAVTERRGVPAHPGSTCWLAYIDNVPVFGLALCGMFSKNTVLDLVLPRFLIGRRITSEELARLGHGGLLSKEMAFRFPPYEELTGD
ncbi:MAG TPA: molybdopterin-binding protein [Chloroflexota bacterium]